MSHGLEPGDLREEVTILEDTGSTGDALGGTTAAVFTPIATDPEEYVEILTLNSSQRMIGQQAGVPVEYAVTMHYREDVDSTNRLRWDSNGSRILILVGAPMDLGGHQEWLRLMAKEDRD